MIIETAIIGVAAIVVASLATANAIHKRMIDAEAQADPAAEQRRVLERARDFAATARDNGNNPMEVRKNYRIKVERLDDELLKLARRAHE